MSETDAFGREREHDPLAAMGWSSDVAATATETRAAAPPAQPTREDLPGGAPASPLPYTIPSYGPTPRRGGRSPLRWVRRLVVLGVIVGTGAIVYGSVEPMVSDAVDEVKDALDTTEITGSGPSVTGTAEPDIEPPVGLQQRSLFLRGNLAPALADMRRRAGGEIRTLRLASDRIDLTVVTRSGRMRTFQRRWDSETQMLSDTSAPGLQSAPGVRWSQLNASAPRRIARRMTAGGRPSREIDYMVLINAAGVRWSAFRTDGTHYDASPDGRRVRRVGG